MGGQLEALRPSVVQLQAQVMSVQEQENIGSYTEEATGQPLDPPKKSRNVTQSAAFSRGMTILRVRSLSCHNI